MTAPQTLLLLRSISGLTGAGSPNALVDCVKGVAKGVGFAEEEKKDEGEDEEDEEG
jgi:hypothetical protein